MAQRTLSAMAVRIVARRTRLQYAAIAMAAVFGIAPSRPTQAANTHFSDSTARTQEPRRFELGFTKASTLGIARNIELQLNPLAFLLLPHAGAKINWIDGGAALQVGTLHRLAYPSWFLKQVARVGTGGLLPAKARIPQAVLLDQDLLLSTSWRAQWLTLSPGFSVAPRWTGYGPRPQESLLDFPFLFQRLAALHGVVAPRARLLLAGTLGSGLSYEAELRGDYFFLEQLDGELRRTYASFELAAELQLLTTPSQRLDVGIRMAHTELPIGWRSYFLPVLDYRFRF